MVPKKLSTEQEDQLENSMDADKCGTLVETAANMFNIPKRTLNL